MLLNTVARLKLRQFVANQKMSQKTAEQLHPHHLAIFECEHYCYLIEKQPHAICFEVLIDLTKNDCALLLRDDIIAFTKREHLDINTVFRAVKDKLIDKFGVSLTQLFLAETVNYAELTELHAVKHVDFAILRHHAYFASWINDNLCTMQDVLDLDLLTVTINVYASRLFALSQNYTDPLMTSSDTLESIQYELQTIAEYHVTEKNFLKEQLTHALLLLFRNSLKVKQSTNSKFCDLQEKCIEIIDTCQENNWQRALDELIYLSFSAKMKPSGAAPEKRSLLAIHSNRDYSRKKEDNVSTFYSSLIKLKSLLPATLNGA